MDKNILIYYRALRNLQTLSPCPASQMVGVLFAEREPTPPYLIKGISLYFTINICFSVFLD